MDDSIKIVVKCNLDDCIKVLKPEVDKWFNGNQVPKTEEELDYANTIFSLYDRLKNIMDYLEKSGVE